MQSLSSLTISGLEQVIADYPWFAAARHELFLRKVQSGADAAEAASVAALFVPSRAMLWQEALSNQLQDKPEAQPAATARQPRPRYVIAGADYFSRRDFEDLEKSGESFSFGRIHLAGLTEDSGAENREEDRHVQAAAAESAGAASSTDVYTETLAGIYARQGHFDRAIEVYRKLILLYPEKSAYFAALIDKIESKIKNI